MEDLEIEKVREHFHFLYKLSKGIQDQIFILLP